MPVGKYKRSLRIDAQPPNPFAVAGADGGAFDSGTAGAPPAPPTIPAPIGLTLTPSLLNSAATPSAQIAATWAGLETYDSETYRVQVATDSGFTQVAGVWATGQNQASAVIGPLKVNTTYYVRVQTIVGQFESDWSASLSTTTPSDTTAPAAPSGQAAAFIGGGDLVVTWTNPTSANFRDVEIAIYESASKVTLYGAFFDATQRFVWPAAANLAATSGVGDPTLYVELRSRSWGNVFSAAVTTGLVTKAAPATPSGITQTWSGDTGTAGADWTIAWAPQSDATMWRLTINGGTPRTIASTTYTYTLDANIAQNASADPTLTYSLVAVDALLQSSAVAASGTATNAAPPTTALTAVGAVQAIAVSITPSTAADIAAYSLRIVKDGATQATVTTRATTALLDVGPYGSGTYQIGVTVVDAFGQSSTETLSSGAFLEPFNLTAFRIGARYRDSLGTSSTSLDALKDTNLVSGGISYT